MRTIKFQLVFDTAIGTYITKQSYTIEDFLNFRYGLDCLLEKETENFTMHDHDAFFYYEPKLIAKRQFTGILDKNGVEIYADSSIVEFNYKNVKQYGYFSFDDTVLAYVIKLFNSKQTGISAYLYSKFTIENIKIIDTIQENKLNLFENTP